MLVLAFKRMVTAAVITLSLGNFAWASSINMQVLELAEEKKFEQALALLSQESSELRTGYDHRFLKARVLSWNGQYAEARAELHALIAEYSDNPDLRLVMGNLEYYEGDLSAAEKNYQAVLNKFPGYQDARKGLENVRKVKLAELSKSKNEWRIDGGLSVSDFEQENLTKWNTQYLRAEYAPNSFAYHASVQRYERFGRANVQIQGGVSDAVRGGWDWGVEAGFTPDALFRPKVSAGGRLGRAIETKNGTVVYPSITYRYDDYAVGGIHNIQPGIITYLDKGIVLTGRLIGTVQDNEKDQLGWLVQGRMPIIDKLEVNLGLAKAPEAINGFAITTQSLFGGFTYKVRDDLNVHLNLARDDREESYIRNSVNVGFTHKR